MARNEEKQLGKLNRLWLQKEREEGRIKDAIEQRPKLSTLNSAASVKKWIPSIKKEIEYYLQQSELSHYPERKIAEFQLCIENLEKEYKRFLTKLRAFDPSYKHTPWTPRAYTKRRAETALTGSPSSYSSSSTVKKQRWQEPGDLSCSACDGDCGITSHKTGSSTTPADIRWPQSGGPEATIKFSAPPNSCAQLSGVDQDQPLSFDQRRLAVAVAGQRGPVVQSGSSPTQSLARVLHSSLPNLSCSPLSQTIVAQNKHTSGAKDEHILVTSVPEEKDAVTERKLGTVKPNESGPTVETMGHVLGLDCYSSSDEESDT